MINFKLLQDSIDYYETCYFKRIETPWTVSEVISNLTKPDDRINYQLKHNDKCLVASAEQGYLYLMNKGFLPKGKYQSISPCFRDDNFSIVHTKYFIKNELIITDNVNEKSLFELIETCKMFFENQIKQKVDMIKTDVGFDLEYKGIELGSYGINDFGWTRYCYGTGLAEPRFSRMKEMFEL